MEIYSLSLYLSSRIWNFLSCSSWIYSSLNRCNLFQSATFSLFPQLCCGLGISSKMGHSTAAIQWRRELLWVCYIWKPCLHISDSLWFFVFGFFFLFFPHQHITPVSFQLLLHKDHWSAMASRFLGPSGGGKPSFEAQQGSVQAGCWLPWQLPTQFWAKCSFTG